MEDPLSSTPQWPNAAPAAGYDGTHDIGCKAGTSAAERFLVMLGDPARTIDAARTMAVFAHPDDETIAVGAQLRRLAGVRLLHVTDGAPASGTDASACGFSRREDYAAARRLELAAAVAQAGVPREALLTLGATDQAAAFRMPDLTGRLAAILRAHAAEIVITHAFEGGHPDHDATAFVAHAACRLIENRGAAAPAIVECPLYHGCDGGCVFQAFAPVPKPRGRELTTALDPATADAKRRMLAAHVTQRRTLAPFTTALERFRPAPRYDFAQLPNGGELLYESYDWGLTGADWLRLAQAARRALELP